jgi:acyl-homoserine-lactone acylase
LSPQKMPICRRSKAALLLSGLMASFWLAGCSDHSEPTVPEPPSKVSVEIRRTSFGVPHIVGKDLRSAAYGMAYVYAQDNICLAADRLITVAGERSRYLGGVAPASPGSTVSNLRSDFFYRNVLDQAAVDRAFASAGTITADAISGYVAGYNRFLADAKASDFGECAGAAWATRPMTENDMRRHLLALSIQSGAGAFIAAIADAAPPAGIFPANRAAPDAPFVAGHHANKGASLANVKRSALQFAKAFDARPMGSNGQAFGGEVTENGGGILVGTPHFPWAGILRFYQAHVSVAGQYNVMGASLGLAPLPIIGFNNDVAWTHTVSTGRRFTLYELTLNGTNYVVDGVSRPIQTKRVTVDVLENGVITPQTRTYYASHHGPMLVSAALGATWTATKAYAIRDANLDNGRFIEQLWETGRTTSIGELRDTISRRMALPWVNTIAADRGGGAFYADYSVTPNVSAAQLANCATSAQAQALAAARTYLLDGTRAVCDWAVDPAAVSPGIMPQSSLPMLTRRDYVGNHNESAWLTNPAQLLTGFSPLVGFEARTQSLRTRMGFTQVQDRLAARDGLAGNQVSPDNLESIFFQTRMMSAELMMPALPAMCGAGATVTATNGVEVNIAEACTVLAAWDRRAKISSVGVPVFREFWRRAQNIPQLFATPFSAADPINTPRNPNTGDPTVLAAMRRALADAVLALNAANVPLNATLGSVQYVTRGGERLPMDGGDEFEGIFNKMTPPGAGLGAGGYTDIVSGSTYIQIVSFDAGGPIARGLLTYGQSTNAASPHFADQTRQFSAGKFVKLPYRESEIAADPKLTAALVLTEK